MHHPFIPLVVLSLVTHVHSRFIEHGVVPVNMIRHQRRGIDQSVLLENGKEAQKLNAKFARMEGNVQCFAGESACVSGGFAQCVGGKFVGEPCAQGLKCFAMRELLSEIYRRLQGPLLTRCLLNYAALLLKKGTALGCDTEADATSRISNSGATGGLTGTGDSGKTAQNNSTEAPSSADTSANATQSDSTEKDDDSKGSTANVTADTSKNSTSRDPSTGSSNASEISDSGTDEKKTSTPMDPSSGASNSADPSASGTDKDSKNSSDTSDSKSDPDKTSEEGKNSTSASTGKDKKDQAPAKGADNEEAENLNFAKDKSDDKECPEES
ncbi:hypothetical protein VP01_1337g4 [Puccinia sorghi]|uniref:Uncharacterized protein n=1 Tax=Puccinia sorghi TaxID=27349 RepID=A0A0L6VMX1_9BASI|nr:hypothetical protein VP01_1337g4 [Puccinia sorghi]